jgi:hypothetical protein
MPLEYIFAKACSRRPTPQPYAATNARATRRVVTNLDVPHRVVRGQSEVRSNAIQLRNVLVRHIARDDHHRHRSRHGSQYPARDLMTSCDAAARQLRASRRSRPRGGAAATDRQERGF